MQQCGTERSGTGFSRRGGMNHGQDAHATSKLIPCQVQVTLAPPPESEALPSRPCGLKQSHHEDTNGQSEEQADTRRASNGVRFTRFAWKARTVALLED